VAEGVQGKPLPRGYAIDEQYAEFRKAVAEARIPVVDQDFRDAWWDWKVLDFEQKAKAIEGIRDRIAAGCDPNFIPRPKKYIAQREWDRVIAVHTGRGQTISEAAKEGW